MSAEQLYTFAILQVSLVLLLASSRVRPPERDMLGLRYLQAALSCEAISWLFYLWPQSFYPLVISSVASAANIWLLLIFACLRAGVPVKAHWFIPAVVLHGAVYSYVSYAELQRLSLHFMTFIALVVALPSAWLFCCKKAQRTVSDRFYALVMLIWFSVCVLRSWTLELHPEWLQSSYLVSQALWPGIIAAYGIFALTSYLEETQTQLKMEAMLDPLTGQLNRRGLQDVIQACIAYLKRHQKQGAILMIDLDHFKQINDTCGHEIGDQVLIRVAQQLKQTLRQSDILARLGGEEFLVVLPLSDAAMASFTAERLRAAIEQLHWEILLPTKRLTVSIGVSMIGPDYDFAQRLHAADLALYQAKSQGRNRVHVAALEQDSDAT